MWYICKSNDLYHPSKSDPMSRLSLPSLYFKTYLCWIRILWFVFFVLFCFVFSTLKMLLYCLLGCIIYKGNLLLSTSLFRCSKFVLFSLADFYILSLSLVLSSLVHDSFIGFLELFGSVGL